MSNTGGPTWQEGHLDCSIYGSQHSKFVYLIADIFNGLTGQLQNKKQKQKQRQHNNNNKNIIAPSGEVGLWVLALWSWITVLLCVSSVGCLLLFSIWKILFYTFPFATSGRFKLYAFHPWYLSSGLL